MAQFRYYLLGMLLLAGFGATGCSEDTTTDPSPVHVHEHAGILFLNAATSQPMTMLVVDGVAIATREYDVIKENYAEIEAGSYKTLITRAGLTDALTEMDLTFEKDARYSLFAVTDADDEIDAVLFEDDLTEPAADKAHMRLAHLVADAPSVRMAFAASGQGAIVQDIEYKENSEFFQAVTPGTYDIRVQANSGGGGGGGGGGGTSGLVPDLSATIEAGKIYTVVFRGNLEDGTGELVLITHEDTLQ